MTGMSRSLPAALASCALVVSLAAQSQGIVIVQEETRDGKVTTNTMQMDRSHMRMETGGSMVVIFDGEAEVMRTINMERKSYTEMDKAQLQQMSQQMSAAMEQLKNLPPEQRAMMEKMMKGRGGMPGMPGMASTPVTYRAAGADKAGRWACTRYDGTRDQQKVVELCTVAPTALGLTEADFAVAKRLADFLKSLMPQIADQVTLNASEAEQGYSGIPIRRTDYSGGKVRAVSELKDIRREAIPASAWQVPAGFKRENIGR
jgi:hypothetical protein